MTHNVFVIVTLDLIIKQYNKSNLGKNLIWGYANSFL